MRIVVTLAAVLLATTLSAQSVVKSEAGERWWAMPLSSQGVTVSSVDPTDVVQKSSALVSSKGRYIYADGQLFDYRIDGQKVEITSADYQPMKGGKSLRDATLMVGQKMKMNSKYDASLAPVYIADCGEEALELFADSELPSGVVVVKSWQSREGSLRFASDRVVEILKTLREKGYSPVLEVTPLLSGDCTEALEAIESGSVVTIADSKPLIVRHSGGFSLMYDLSTEGSAALFNRRAKAAMDLSSAVGVYFNYSDVVPYMGEMSLSGGGTQLLAESFAGSTDSLKVANSALDNVVVTHPVSSKGAMEELIKMTIASHYGSVRGIVADGVSDSEALKLYLTSLFMPVRQIQITDNFARELDSYRKGEQLRATILPALKDAIIEGQRTAAPVVRHMEYEFPGKGFNNCDDQFMVGSRYLVAPHTSDKDRMVRLPTGKWRSSTGEVIKGPMVISVPQTVLVPYYERVKK